MNDSSSLKRRQFLAGLLKLLFFIGFIFISIPFISSFSSNSINEKKITITPWVMEVPLPNLVTGNITSLSWSGGHAWIYARTINDIKNLKKVTTSLHDAFSRQSAQPDAMKNNFRSVSEKYFVFIPFENKRNCQVRLYESDNNEPEKIVFTEPCFSAKYDAAGRILKNSGHKDQQNLSVPAHIIEDGILKIGIWAPNYKNE